MASASGENEGTYACPICGYASPHAHAPGALEALNADRVRADGWISLASCRVPQQSGQYLCCGHEIIVKGARDDDLRRRIQLERADELPRVEVLYFWAVHNIWRLVQAPWAGRSGHRHNVYVAPKFWRPLPPIPEPTP